MLKALILQAQHDLGDAKMEFMIRDRLSWMRFLRFDLGGPTPNENTIRHFRNSLTETGTLRRVMKAFERPFGFIRESAVTSASQADGRMLPRLVTTQNTSSEVWADSAYRSRTNEKRLSAKMLVSRIHRRRPQGRPMPRHVARANAGKSAIRAAVEHVFAHRKNRFGLSIRTNGLARAEAKIILANIATNFDRLMFHERARAMG